MSKLFALVQAALLAGASLASATGTTPQEDRRVMECTPGLVQDFDFTMDNAIGKVEFIQLLEELAPPTCDVVSLWQTKKNHFQSALDDLSCLCTEFGGDANCCHGSSSQALFSVQGVYDQAYDYAVCERIEEVIRVGCFEEDEEISKPSSPAESSPSKPPATANNNLRTAEEIHTTTTMGTPPQEAASTTDVASASASIVGILIICAILLFKILHTSTIETTEAAKTRHRALLDEEKKSFGASMETTSTVPYVQIV